MCILKKLIGVVYAMSTLLLVACAPVVTNPVTVDTLPIVDSKIDKQTYLSKNYIIAPGNLLGIKFFHTPKLDEEVVVRPDGKISLQLVHDVMAVGLTPQQLTEQLKRAYRGQLKKPEIAVIVRSIASQIYVDGEVESPTMLELSGPTSVMQSIAFAGGFTDRARLKEVVVIRRTPELIVITANLEDVISGEDTSQDINLLPSDIVYVPRTPIANVNVWVDQYIRRNIPFPIRY